MTLWRHYVMTSSTGASKRPFPITWEPMDGYWQTFFSFVHFLTWGIDLWYFQTSRTPRLAKKRTWEGPRTPERPRKWFSRYLAYMMTGLSNFCFVSYTVGHKKLIKTTQNRVGPHFGVLGHDLEPPKIRIRAPETAFCDILYIHWPHWANFFVCFLCCWTKEIN